MSQQAIGWTILIVIGTFLLWSAIWTEAQQSGWRYVLGAAGFTLVIALAILYAFYLITGGK